MLANMKRLNDPRNQGELREANWKGLDEALAEIAGARKGLWATPSIKETEEAFKSMEQDPDVNGHSPGIPVRPGEIIPLGSDPQFKDF